MTTENISTDPSFFTILLTPDHFIQTQVIFAVIYFISYAIIVFINNGKLDTGTAGKFLASGSSVPPYLALMSLPFSQRAYALLSSGATKIYIFIAGAMLLFISIQGVCSLHSDLRRSKNSISTPGTVAPAEATNGS